MITVFYNDITSVSHTSVTLPDIDENVAEMRENARGYLFRSEVTKNRTTIVIKSINSAKSTVINNVVETFQKHNIFPEYMELWYIKGRDKRVKSLYIVKCVVNEAKAKGVAIAPRRFERYLHRYIKPMSVFDMKGFNG